MSADVDAMERLALEPLSVMGLPPVEYARLAGELGFRRLTIPLAPLPNNVGNYPEWSLRHDTGLQRRLKSALREAGLAVSLVDCILIFENTSSEALTADVELAAQLGASRVNAMSLDSDRGRTVERMVEVAELAAAAGMETTIEFCPPTPTPDLASAVDLVRRVGRQDFKLLVDAMHLFRSGGSVADLAALEPGMLGYVHLCDVSLAPATPDYNEETCFERLSPGEGELPLLEMLTVLPEELTIGLEVPSRTLALAGVGPRERLAQCLNAAWLLLDAAERSRRSHAAAVELGSPSFRS